MMFDTARLLKLRVLFCHMVCLVIAPTLSAQQTTHITVHGDTYYRLHGTDTIVPTQFGFNQGSGGTGGTEKVQANWFRSTSPTTLTRKVEQDPHAPGTVDTNWLEKTYDLSIPQPENNRLKYGKILLFHPSSKDGKVNWLNPLTGDDARDEQATKQWARIAARAAAYHSRPFADGSRPRVMFEFGNELMFQHYLHTPLFDRDVNRSGPGMNGYQAALAMARWVNESAKAMRSLTPDIKILAGSGDMTLSTRDFWGWQCWDKPLLDQCTPLIDGYATHWYAQPPQLMLAEAALIRAYTQSRFNKPLSTHVTEYGHPKTGEEQPMDRQWFRVRFHGDVLFMAMRDPDKIAGLYSFIWSDPKYMPYFQVKGTPLEKWFELFSDLQGQRVYVESDDTQQLHMQASVHENKLTVVIQNNHQNAQHMAMTLKAPASRRFIAWQWRTLAYDPNMQQPQNTEKQGEFTSLKSQWQLPEMVLNAGQTVSVSMTLVDAKNKLGNKQVTTTSYASRDVMVDAGKVLAIDIPDAVLQNKRYASLRMGLSTLDSQWADTLVQVNDTWYRVDLPLDRKPVRWVEIPVQMPDLKSANHVVLQSSADPSLRVMVAEIEVSDVPMLSQQAIPVSQMVQIQLPSPSITAGQTVMLTTKLHDREALLEEVHWDLPTGWDVQSTDNGYALHVPVDCKGDWYPIRLHARTHDGKTVASQCQVRVLAPVVCTRFTSQSQSSILSDELLANLKQQSAYTIEAPVLQMQNLAWMPGHRESVDTGRKLCIAYDDKTFYFAAVIPGTDWQAKKMPWIDLFFDMGMERSRFAFDRNDQQFIIKCQPDGKAIVEQIIWAGRTPMTTLSPQPDAQACWKVIDGQTWIWGQLDAPAFNGHWAPAPQRQVGFDFRINHQIQWYSRGYEQMVTQFPLTESWGREQMLQHPAAWSRLIFE